MAIKNGDFHSYATENQSKCHGWISSTVNSYGWMVFRIPAQQLIDGKHPMVVDRILTWQTCHDEFRHHFQAHATLDSIIFWKDKSPGTFRVKINRNHPIGGGTPWDENHQSEVQLPARCWFVEPDAVPCLVDVSIGKIRFKSQGFQEIAIRS